MKFSAATLLVSAALATLASAAPMLSNPESQIPGVSVNPLQKRCSECSQVDGTALDLIVKVSATHYSEIAHARLDALMQEITDAKVTSGSQELPQEKAVLSVAVQTNIDQAKQDCTPETLAPIIKASVETNSNMDVRWSKQEEIQQKMVELDVMLTKLILDRIQANVNAIDLSKDCTEKMTNTEIAPAPATPAPAPAAPAPAPEAPAPAPAAPAPAPEAVAPAPVAPAAAAPEGAQPGIDVAASVDSKFVCKTGCKDSQDASTVLSLRVNLENAFSPRLDHFYENEVPKDCTEKRESLLGNLLSVVANLNVEADAKAQA